MKDNTMKTKNRIFLVAACSVLLLSCSVNVYADDPGADFADCAITVTVESIIEWEGAWFPAIDLDAQSGDAPIDERGDDPTGTSAFTLWTNCNVELSADNTATARLTDGTDVLITKYQIATDGDGVTATGATAGAVTASSSNVWTAYDTFLATPLAITHFNTDGGVEVTLSVQATNEADEVADSGSYSATQRITATWTSDD